MTTNVLVQPSKHILLKLMHVHVCECVSAIASRLRQQSYAKTLVAMQRFAMFIVAGIYGNTQNTQHKYTHMHS